MNSIDTFTTTALDLVHLAKGNDPDAVFVAVDDVDHRGVKGTRAILPIQYTVKNGREVILDLGEYGERTYSADDVVTWHVFRYDIKF